FDVRRDLDLLDQGGQTANQVMQRLGVRTPQEASAQLMTEGEAFLQAGQTMPGASQPRQRPGPVPVQTQAEQVRPPEIQQFVRQFGAQGGIKFRPEEWTNEWQGAIQNRQTGTSGLVNNKGGSSLQDVANAAHEAGYIETADTEALREALRDSVSMGR